MEFQPENALWGGLGLSGAIKFFPCKITPDLVCEECQEKAEGGKGGLGGCFIPPQSPWELPSWKRWKIPPGIGWKATLTSHNDSDSRGWREPQPALPANIP